MSFKVAFIRRGEKENGNYKKCLVKLNSKERNSSSAMKLDRETKNKMLKIDIFRYFEKENFVYSV